MACNSVEKATSARAFGIFMKWEFLKLKKENNMPLRSKSIRKAQSTLLLKEVGRR